MDLINKPKNNWGNILWSFIHTITVTNNYENTLTVKKILGNITNIIPCGSCIGTYKIYLERLGSLDLTQPMVLFRWSVDLHNAVNKKLGKPEWNYEDARKHWSKQVPKII